LQIRLTTAEHFLSIPALLLSFFFPAVMLDRGNASPESSSSIPSLHASLDLTSIPTETIPYSPTDKESFDARKGSPDSILLLT